MQRILLQMCMKTKILLTTINTSDIYPIDSHHWFNIGLNVKYQQIALLSPHHSVGQRTAEFLPVKIKKAYKRICLLVWAHDSNSHDHFALEWFLPFCSCHITNATCNKLFFSTTIFIKFDCPTAAIQNRKNTSKIKTFILVSQTALQYLWI